MKTDLPFPMPVIRFKVYATHFGGSPLPNGRNHWGTTLEEVGDCDSIAEANSCRDRLDFDCFEYSHTSMVEVEQ